MKFWLGKRTANLVTKFLDLGSSVLQNAPDVFVDVVGGDLKWKEAWNKRFNQTVTIVWNKI